MGRMLNLMLNLILLHSYQTRPNCTAGAAHPRSVDGHPYLDPEEHDAHYVDAGHVDGVQRQTEARDAQEAGHAAA